MSKILVPTDFSPGSREAVRVAIQIAKDTGAEIVIAHAWYVPPLAFGIEPYTFSSELLQQMSDDAKRGLDAALAEAKQLGASAVTSIMLTGTPPWARIVDVVEADPAFDLVVMGTHGLTGLKRVMLGSVAEKVVRHAPCSVLAVRADGEPAARFTDVLCPVDFSSASTIAIDTARKLVVPGGTGITLLHVIEAPIRQAGDGYEPSFLRELDKHAAAALDKLAAELRAKTTVQVTTTIRLGYAGAQILALLDDTPFEIVVMGSHGRTGLRRALLGSVAEKTVRHAPCPVLIARDRNA